MSQLIGAFPTVCADCTWDPFINHSTTLPLLSRQRISLRPSPLKSPVPASCHCGPGLPSETAEASCPAALVCQSATDPLSLTNRMSLRPFPSKSATSATCQELATV